VHRLPREVLRKRDRHRTSTNFAYGRRVLHYEEICDSYRLLVIVRVVKSGGGGGYVARGEAEGS
jgi:hypothetical protein